MIDISVSDVDITIRNSLYIIEKRKNGADPSQDFLDMSRESQERFVDNASKDEIDEVVFGGQSSLEAF